MKIYNKTNQIQELLVNDRCAHSQYLIYVNAKGTTSLDAHIFAPSLPKLVSAGIFQILDEKVCNCKEHCKIETSTEEVNTEENPEVDSVDSGENMDISEETNPTEENNEVVDSPIPEEKSEVNEEVTKFICDVCGGEFASSRGLTRHKSMAHGS